MSTARHAQRNRQIVEIERTPFRPDPTVGDLTPELASVPRRHDPTIVLLLVSSVVFFVVGIATMSIVAWFAGVVSIVTALSVDTSHERELRDVRRSGEVEQLRHRHREAAQVERRATSRPGAHVEGAAGPFLPPACLFG